MIEVPSVVPEFVDQGPVLRARASTLLDQVFGSVSVSTWRDSTCGVRVVLYDGFAPVDPEGCRRIRVVLTVPGQEPYVVRVQGSEPTSTDVDRAVVALLERAARRARRKHRNK